MIDKILDRHIRAYIEFICEIKIDRTISMSSWLLLVEMAKEDLQKSIDSDRFLYQQVKFLCNDD